MYKIFRQFQGKDNLVEIKENEKIKLISNYKFGKFEWISDSRPKCQCCGSDLSFQLKGRKMVILNCLNSICETNRDGLRYGDPLRRKYFIPNYLEAKYIENHKNIMLRQFDPAYISKIKNISLEEANKIIIEKKQKLSESSKKIRSGVPLKYWYQRKYGGLWEEKMKESNPLNALHYIKQGKTLEEAKEIISKLQSNNSHKVKNRYGRTKESLIEKGIDPNKFIRETSIWCTEYYIKKGKTLEEAKEIISKLQSDNSHKVNNEARRLSSCRCIDHYMHLGYTNEESKVLVKKYQTTFSKSICIKKYGHDKGIEIWKDRQIRWQETLHKNGNLHVGYSKISQELFNAICPSNKQKIQYATLNKEFLIRDNGKNYSFDYADLEQNILIEFQGDIYHANPKLFRGDECPSPFSNMTSAEIWEKDHKKQDVANKNGFKVIYVWEKDYRNNKNEIVSKLKNELNYG